MFKKIVFGVFLLLACQWTSAYSQNQKAYIMDVRREIGETDSTRSKVENADIRMWINQFLRILPNYGVVLKHIELTGASGKDTLTLPSDFIFPVTIDKDVSGQAQKITAVRGGYDSTSLHQSKSGRKPILLERSANKTISGGVSSVVMSDDVYDVEFCMDKDPSGADRLFLMKRIFNDSEAVMIPQDRMKFTKLTLAAGKDTTGAPIDFGVEEIVTKYVRGNKKLGLIRMRPDSMTWDIQKMAPGTFYTRLDTIVPSVTNPINVLGYDVGSVLSAWRKDRVDDPGALKQLTQVSRDSLGHIQSDAYLFYYVSGWPNPTIVFGSPFPFIDTVYLEVAAIIPRYHIMTGLDTLHLMTIMPANPMADSVFLTYRPYKSLYLFTSYPQPVLTVFPTFSAARNLVARELFVAPQYEIFESKPDTITANHKKWIKFYPGLLASENVRVLYSASIDTMPTADAAANTALLEAPLRVAMVKYAAAQFFDMKNLDAEMHKANALWTMILGDYAKNKGVVPRPVTIMQQPQQ